MKAIETIEQPQLTEVIGLVLDQEDQRAQA